MRHIGHCLHFVFFPLEVIKFCSGRPFFSNHLILSRFVFTICQLLHSLRCKASKTLSLKFSLSRIFTECSHSQEIFVPWLVAPQVSLCPVSPKRLVQLIVPSCYSFSSSCSLPLLVMSHPEPLSLTMQPYSDAVFQSSLTVQTFFL